MKLNMFVVVDIAGHQYKVAKGDKVRVNKLEAKEGEKVVLNTVLLTSADEGKTVKIGEPFVSGAQVEAKVLSHGRADKIRVFKMKPKKRYRKTQGHRQDYTELEITAVK